MKRILTPTALLALTGCATCEKHDLACAVVVGVAAGCIAASSSHRTQAHDVSSQPVICTAGSCK